MGSKKVPPSAWRLPPVSTVAPWATASAMCSSTLATAAASISGPWSCSPIRPSPTRSFATASASLRAKASYTPSCTSRRLAHTQVWPEFRYLLTMAPATAASRSASSKTMNGALPPSSIETFFTVCAHWASSSLPVAVEPVNVSLRTSGLPVISPPMARASPVTTLTTPAGMPARCASSARASAEKGVWDAGLITMVQPAARAGASLRAIIADGKFHGVIAATTPTGCLRTTMRRSFA